MASGLGGSVKWRVYAHGLPAMGWAAFLMVTALAWAYTTFGQTPQAAGLLYGIKPVIIAVIAQALWGYIADKFGRRKLLVLIG